MQFSPPVASGEGACYLFTMDRDDLDRIREISEESLVTEERYRRVLHFLTARQETLRLFLDDVKNAHNISAVIRTCDATGVFTVHYYLTEASLSINRGISLGSEQWIQLERVQDRTAFLARMRERSYQCLATSLDPPTIDYREVDYTRPTLLIFGNEKDGISGEVMDHVSQRIKIPMMGMAKSLNISVACAVILYEALRQRDGKGMYETPSLPRETFEAYLRKWTIEDRLKK